MQPFIASAVEDKNGPTEQAATGPGGQTCIPLAHGPANDLNRHCHVNGRGLLNIPFSLRDIEGHLTGKTMRHNCVVWGWGQIFLESS
jgi:hypothetical protein